MADKRTRHGLNALMVAVKVRGLGAIDGRTAAARELMRWKKELQDALGGADAISPQRAALVDAAVRSKLFLDSLDAWLLEQRSLVNGRKKAILPALRERQSLADGLLRLLTALGLDRAEKAVISAERLAEVESVLATRDPALFQDAQPQEEKT